VWISRRSSVIICAVCSQRQNVDLHHRSAVHKNINRTHHANCKHRQVARCCTAESLITITVHSLITVIIITHFHTSRCRIVPLRSALGRTAIDHPALTSPSPYISDDALCLQQLNQGERGITGPKDVTERSDQISGNAHFGACPLQLT